MEKELEQKIDNLGTCLNKLHTKFELFHQTLEINTGVLEKHNGRLKKVEEWKLRIDGGKAVINAMWLVLGVFFIASVFGLFNMYVTVARLPEVVELQVIGLIEKKINNNEIQISYDEN